MDPNNNLEHFIKNVELKTKPKTDANVLKKILSVQEKTPEINSAAEPPNIRRIIMQSKIIKYAAAAVIIIGVLITISFLGGSPDGAGVAWARVADKIDQIDTAIYQSKLIISKIDGTEESGGATHYYSREYGYRRDMKEDSEDHMLIMYYSARDNVEILRP